MTLVKAYLELYLRYNQPNYYFRLAQLRNILSTEDSLAKKGAEASLKDKRGTWLQDGLLSFAELQ